MSLVVQVRHVTHAGVVVLGVRGECDVFGADALREHLARQIGAGRMELIADLTGLTFIDSTGVGVLVSARKHVGEHQGRLHLVIDEERVHKIFRISALTHLFPIHVTLEEALAAWP